MISDQSRHPKNATVVLLDSPNRHMLEAYGEFTSPAVLARMPGSRVPVIRQPFDGSDRLPFWAMGRFSGHHLYDLATDLAEDRNLAQTAREKDAIDQLRAALIEIEAPSDRFVRLRLD